MKSAAKQTQLLANKYQIQIPKTNIVNSDFPQPHVYKF